MQTTLIIDDDVLAEAGELAKQRSQTVGEVISALTREALHPKQPVYVSRSGMPLLPVKDMTPVTLEFVNELRDECP